MFKSVLFILCIQFAFSLTPDQNKLLGTLINYLNGVRMLEADFAQLSKDQDPILGHLKLWRPSDSKNDSYGYLKLSYNPPYPYLFLVQKGTLIQYALKTKEKDVYDLTSTPLGIILKNKIDLSKKSGVKVLGIKENDEEINLKLTHTDNETMSLHLLFAKKPFLILKGWIVIDPQGNTTHIQLDYISTAGKKSGIVINSNKLNEKDFVLPS